MRILVSVLAILAWLALPSAANAQDNPIAHVKTVSGKVSLVADGVEEEAVPGDPIYAADRIVTGADGKIGLTLLDNTRISLGPNSEVSVSEFTFKPDTKDYKLVTDISKGTMMFVSGLIGKLSPDSAQVRTPSGTIGIRGTKFLVRVGDDS